MRELNVVGLDVDGTRIVCEVNGTGEKFLLRPGDRLKAALRGDRATAETGRPAQTTTAPAGPSETEVPNVLRPRDIQARIRAGASVEEVAEAAGVDIERVDRFAHPVLLERSRAAELATASHPVLSDGPAVLTLVEIVTTALVARGLDPAATAWDAWRNEDGRWTVQLTWQAGRSENAAHFRFQPGSHGGTTTPLDDSAAELVDPGYSRPPLRSVTRTSAPTPEPELDLEIDTAPAAPPAPAEPTAPAAQTARSRKRRPEVPAWEDVLLGVRSGTQS